MTDLTAVLKIAAPRANPAFLKASAAVLPGIMAAHGFTTVNAQAMLIAETAHESGGFRAFEENLNYSAAQLQKTWPRRFNAETAAACARKPKAIALKVYGDRMGNRPGTDDGWNYRGSNVLQHTGAGEFKRVELRTGLPVLAHPDMLRDPANAEAGWKAACTFFVDRHALEPARAGNVEQTTLKVNGGSIGLADRKVLFTRTVAAFEGTAIPAGKTTVEQADDAKRKAKQAATAAPVGAGTTGEGSRQSGLQPGQAVAIGLVVLVVFAVIGIVYWRVHRAKRAQVEDMQLQTIASRIAAAPEQAGASDPSASGAENP